MHVEPLTLLTLLVVVGVGMQWVAARTRLPALLLLLAAGIVLGPVTEVVQPYLVFDAGLLEAVVALAVAVVLFEGGLSLNLNEARRVGPTLGALIVSGLVLGFGLVTALGLLVGLSLPTSATLGAILVVTGPTVIGPMLRTARVAMRPAALLKWEGIVNDPLGALLAYFVLQAALIGHEEGASHGVAALALQFLVSTLAAAGLGTASGLGLGRALTRNWIPEHLRSPVILAAVVGVYSVCEEFQAESGLLAVTLMGVVLANLEDTPIDDIQHFKEQITTLLVAFLFLVLSARLDPGILGALAGKPLLLVAGVVFVVRPLVVLAATWRSPLPWAERLFVGWIAPRGVVAAAVAGAFAPELAANGYPDAELLVAIVFGVIATTVALHGLTIRPLASRLGLAAREGNGTLIVGASIWATALAHALESAGAFVVLADTRYRRVSRARVAGLEVHHGDVRSEDVMLELPMERVHNVFAATDDDAYNALVALHFTREIGRAHVFALTPQAAGTAEGQAHSGNHPWGPEATYPEVTRRFWLGETFRVTTITGAFGFSQLRENNPGALFLLQVAGPRLGVITADQEPKTGAKVVFLAPAT